MFEDVIKQLQEIIKEKDDRELKVQIAKLVRDIRKWSEKCECEDTDVYDKAEYKQNVSIWRKIFGIEEE